MARKPVKSGEPGAPIEPGVLDSVDPTFATPLMTGAPSLVRDRSLKWMKPLGQLPLERVMTAHEKSPPQLSWETITSSSETTCSTYAT